MRSASAKDATALSAVFASNFEYLRTAGEIAADADALPAGHVADYLAEEAARSGNRCVVICDTTADDDPGEVVGTATMLVPHLREQHPWIGLLLIDGARQGGGLGAAAADLLEQQLVEEGWTDVRISVLGANPRALAFWQRRGYTAYDHRRDTEGRLGTLLAKALTRTQGSSPSLPAGSTSTAATLSVRMD